MELIGINTCKYGIEYARQKKQAVPQPKAESFAIKRNPAIRAPRIYLSEEEVSRLMEREAAVKKKIGHLIDSMFVMTHILQQWIIQKIRQRHLI